MKFGCWRGEIYESLSNRFYVLDIKGYCRNSITVNRLDESVLSIKFRSLIDSGAAHVWEIPYTGTISDHFLRNGTSKIQLGVDLPQRISADM